MDQKPWLWKQRSGEKTLVDDKPRNSLSNDEEETEMQKILTEKTSLENDVRILNEKLSSALSDCNAKDNIVKKQVKIAEEAIAGWEKAEVEAIALKEEFDKLLQQKAVSEERIDNLDAALKECMQQLRFVREEQERRVHSAVTKTSEEYEKIRISLDEKLVEANKRLAKLDAENALLSGALSRKDKVIEELGKYRSQVEADLTSFLSRVESTEKENASLKYEVHVLEKELDIRNEEREFNRRAADSARKQQDESGERIAKLETECQRLCFLVEKRSLGPATLAKTRNEVEGLDKGTTSTELFHRQMATSDMNLMDDFADMEKLALLSLAECPDNAVVGKPGNPSGARSSFESGRSCASINGCPSENVITGRKTHSGSVEANGIPDTNHDGVSYIDRKSSDKYSNRDLPDKRNGNNISINSDFSIPIRKVLELVEGINVQSQDNGFLSNNISGNPTGYVVRVFQWKTAELFDILQQFVQTCNDLLNGTANLEQFAFQIASSLEWIMNHCFSFQDVSSMKDAIRNRFDWDEYDSGSENDDGSESVSQAHTSCSQIELPINEDVKIWNVDWTNKTGLESCLHSETKDVTQNLHSKMETEVQIERKFEHQLGKQKSNMESNRELSKASQRISVSESSSENRDTCHELPIELSSMKRKEVADDGEHQEKQLYDDWEITAASEKLAECQETIINLGKQLKALASPCDASLFDKVVPAPADSPVERSISRRSSLLNKMLAEDNDTENENNDGNTDSANSDGINHEMTRKTAVASMNIVVPCKKRGATSFFKRLFWRRKKGRKSKTSSS